MTDLFENLGKKLAEVASDVSKVTSDTLEIQKLKSDIRGLKRGNDRDYMDMGKYIFDKFQKGEVIDADLVSLCEAVEKRNEEVEKIEVEIARIKEEI